MTPHHPAADRLFGEGVESWRPVPQFPDYEVSSLGRVRSFKGRSPRLLKPCNGSKRHQFITLFNDLGTKQYRLGPMVLTAFVSERPAGHHAAHLDGNPRNNRLDNLKWCTPAENEAHKKIHGTQVVGEAVKVSVLTEAKVREIRRALSAGRSVRGLAREYGVHRITLRRIQRGKAWMHVA